MFVGGIVDYSNILSYHPYESILNDYIFQSSKLTPYLLSQELRPTICYLSPKELELVHNALRVIHCCSGTLSFFSFIYLDVDLEVTPIAFFVITAGF